MADIIIVKVMEEVLECSQGAAYLGKTMVVFYRDQTCLVGWVGFFFVCVLLGNCFWLVWLINRPQTGLKWLK